MPVLQLKNNIFFRLNFLSKWLFSIFFAIVPVASQLAAADSYNEFHNITLSPVGASIANCFVQDTQGVMWFGTDKGLFSYNGYTVKSHLITTLPNADLIQTRIYCGIMYDAVILHVDQGNNNSRFRWWFDAAKAHGARYDIIGLSYYPYWLTGSPDYTLSINDLGKNMIDMELRYGKEVMVVEVGGEDIKAQNTYDMLVAVQQKVKAVPNQKGLGVFYWEPQGARSWSKYALSCWGNDGKPTKALDAFK